MAGGKQQRKAKKKGGNTKASLPNGNRRDNKKKNKKNSSNVPKGKPMTILPDVCVSKVVAFLDFDSLLAFRCTSKTQQGAADNELMRRAFAALPLTRETDNMRFGYPRTCKMTLRRGWSERWTTREGLVETAMQYAKPAGYFDEDGAPESEVAKAQREKSQKKMLLRTGKVQVTVGPEEHWGTAIPEPNKMVTRQSAWGEVCERFKIFGLGVEYNDDVWLTGLCFFGPDDDSAARASLTPLIQAFGCLLMQAKTENSSSLVAFSRVAFQVETDGSNEDGEECAILFRTKDGQHFQLEIVAKNYAEK